MNITDVFVGHSEGGLAVVSEDVADPPINQLGSPAKDNTSVNVTAEVVGEDSNGSAIQQNASSVTSIQTTNAAGPVVPGSTDNSNRPLEVHETSPQGRYVKVLQFIIHSFLQINIITAFIFFKSWKLVLERERTKTCK